MLLTDSEADQAVQQSRGRDQYPHQQDEAGPADFSKKPFHKRKVSTMVNQMVPKATGDARHQWV